MNVPERKGSRDRRPSPPSTQLLPWAAKWRQRGKNNSEEREMPGEEAELSA